MAMQFDDLPEGWFGPGDIAAYAGLYEQVLPGSRVAELGVWQGRSLCSVAEAIRGKNLQVHAVDTFLGTPRELDIVHDCEGKLRERFEANLARFRIFDHVVIHAGSTDLVAREMGAASLNLVFIDSDHSYERVRADIRAWLPKVKVGGVLCGHDYNCSGHPHGGVKQAVDELIGSDKVVLFPGSLVWSHQVRWSPGRAILQILMQRLGGFGSARIFH
jgi:cephalosporin hydroxylase